MALDVDLADGLAHRSLDERDAALPPRSDRVGAGERASVEVEVLVDEVVGEEGRVTGDDLPREPVLPGVEVRRREECTDGARETGLAQDHLVEGADRYLHAVAPHLEQRAAEELARLGPTD